MAKESRGTSWRTGSSNAQGVFPRGLWEELPPPRGQLKTAPCHRVSPHVCISPRSLSAPFLIFPVHSADVTANSDRGLREASVFPICCKVCFIVSHCRHNKPSPLCAGCVLLGLVTMSQMVTFKTGIGMDYMRSAWGFSMQSPGFYLRKSWAQ